MLRAASASVGALRRGACRRSCPAVARARRARSRAQRGDERAPRARSAGEDARQRVERRAGRSRPSYFLLQQAGHLVVRALHGVHVEHLVGDERRHAAPVALGGLLVQPRCRSRPSRAPRARRGRCASRRRRRSAGAPAPFARSISSRVLPVMTKAVVASVDVAAACGPLLARPALDVRQHASRRRYLTEWNGCTWKPSHSSPASRHM